MQWLLILTLCGFFLACTPEHVEPSGSDLGPTPTPAAEVEGEAPPAEPPPAPPPAEPDHRETAYRYCRHFTEERLKAPASAQWPSYGSVAEFAKDLGDVRFSLTAHVDSQNSFGAMLRSGVRCTVRKEDDMWYLEQLWLKDKLVYLQDIDHGPEGAFKRCKKFTSEMWLNSSRDAKWPQSFKQASVDEFLEKTYRVATFYEKGAESGDVECILRETGKTWYLDVLKIDEQMVFLREGLEPYEYDDAIADFEFAQ